LTRPFVPHATNTSSERLSAKHRGPDLIRPFRRAYANLRIGRAMAVSSFNFRFRRNSPRHALSRPLVVSLTSYPPRFPTLALTLRCLLCQSVRPDRTILWIAPEGQSELPRDVLALQLYGLEIRATRDIGPFTKIVPALQAFPDVIVVTADDDQYYWRTWLEELTSAWSGSTREIVCHRANGIVLDSDGRPRPYGEWPMDAMPEGRSVAVLPTGVEGVMYPPGSLSPRVLDADAFLKLCPRADDIWLYWMARLAGSEFRLTGHGRRPCMWRNSQQVALYRDNVLQNGNDTQIAAMIDAFGWPPGSRANDGPVPLSGDRASLRLTSGDRSAAAAR
jgi:hypothetical protein